MEKKNKYQKKTERIAGSLGRHHAFHMSFVVSVGSTSCQWFPVDFLP
jgi:hypothetical protein